MGLVAPASGWSPLIERAIEGLGDLAGPARATGFAGALGQLLDRVLEWNARTDLTAARSAEELVDLYLADAVVLAGAAATAPGTRVVDVGSGAGAPALPLALLAPVLDLTLVEPRTRRVAFLRSAVGELELPGVRVERARSEDLPSRGWQVAISRATLAPVAWLRQGARLATDEVWVLLAKSDAPMLDGWVAVHDVRYSWPLTGVERRAIGYAPGAR